jgi:TatD DNase family protein
MPFIDVHTHLNMLEMTPEEALASAASNDVDRVITIGTCPDDLDLVLSLAKRLAPKVACTLGIHPHEASLYTPEIGEFIRRHAIEPYVVALGEMGLDYYYNNSPVEVQIEAFRAQLRLAEELNLPVEIHTRDAEADTMKVLKEFNGRVKGLLHCFTGTMEMAQFGLDHGFDISISGVVTFKNAQALRDVVKNVPVERLHCETDAPFLAPIPHRGKKNQPAWMTHTAQLVAELKQIDLYTLQSHLRQNAARLFPKLQLN